MRLVTHAALGCDSTERLGRREHQVLGHLDAAAEQVFAGWDSQRGFEGAAEMARTESNETREVVNVDFLGKVGFDVREHFACLPGRKRSTCDEGA